MKKATKKNDEVYGLSAAASFLGRAESSVLRYANDGSLPCQRDSANKRLFKKSALEKFKRTLNNAHRRVLS